AEVMGIKEGTVMSSLHRAKARLREALLSYAREEGYSFSAKGGDDE
ncbi:MAG: hypothetical protein RLZZ164_361, partial [Actinomycetota bacterium]